MKTKIPVYGMHCSSCEILLESEVSQLPDTKILKISSKGNFLEVDTSEKNLKKIKNIIKKLGYFLEKPTKKAIKNNSFDYIIIFLFFIIIGMFWLIGESMGWTQMMSFDQNGGLAVIFLIGIVASVSTCLAVTGGIVLGFGKYLDTSATFFEKFRIHGGFQLGRIFGFILGGAILGYFGEYLAKLGNFNVYLLGITGIFMLYMGGNILGFFPSITKLGLSLPKSFGNKILSIQNPTFAPIVGALTFFLPCGFTQSMQIMAATSGNMLTGAMIMGVFALGTAPVLTLVGIGGSYLDGNKTKIFTQFVGVLVIYFGIFILSNFLNFFTFTGGKNILSENIQIDYSNRDFESRTLRHNGFTLEEKEIYLKAGGNYKLNIIPEKNGLGCMSTMTIPGLDSSVYRIIAGEPIGILIVDAQPGKYNIICTSMGMKQGEIIIQ